MELKQFKTINKRIKGERKITGKKYIELNKIKIINGHTCCDYPMCNNKAYAEMYILNSGWMYVCKKHFNNNIKKSTGKVKRTNIGFYILPKKLKQ